MSYNFQDHWDKAYQRTTVDKLGWFEENATPTLELMEMMECFLGVTQMIDSSFLMY